jgi:hypothetical protein
MNYKLKSFYRRLRKESRRLRYNNDPNKDEILILIRVLFDIPKSLMMRVLNGDYDLDIELIDNHPHLVFNPQVNLVALS